MTAPKKAEFRIKNSSQRIRTHFNPSTLEITLTTRVGQGQGRRNGGGQVVNESSAKLSVQLVFDTTDTMVNVCDQTVQVARLLGEQGKPPPQVTFDWGSFEFTGIVDSYKETLDFFSDQGVPLRATLALTMKRDEDIFSRGTGSPPPPRRNGGRWSGGPGGGDPAQVNAPPGGGSATTTATRAGAPEAGRAIAAGNGEESMRFLRSPTLTVDASVTLAPPVAFTSPGAGLLRASASLGTSAGAGLPAASFGASLSFGGSASAGVPLSQGAFAGLRLPSPTASASLGLNPRRLLPRAETYTYAADDDAAFELGGRMKTQGTRLGGVARARIRFEEE